MIHGLRRTSLVATLTLLLTISWGPSGLTRFCHKFASLEVEVAVGQHAVQVAQPIAVQIVVRAAAGTVIEFPQMQDRWGDWEVLSWQDQPDVPDASETGLRLWTRRMLLESLTSGSVALPEMQIEAVLPSGVRESLSTESQTIQVISQLQERDSPSQFRDIQGSVQATSPEKQAWVWLPWIAIAMGALGLLSYVAVRIFRRRQKVSPAQWALSELEVLKNSLPEISVQGAGSKGNYQRIGDVLQTYFQARTGLCAQQMTVQELRQALETVLRSSPRGAKAGEAWCGLHANKLWWLLCEVERARFSLTSQPDGAVLRVTQQAIDWIQGLETALDSRQSTNLAVQESA